MNFAARHAQLHIFPSSMQHLHACESVSAIAWLRGCAGTNMIVVVFVRAQTGGYDTSDVVCQLRGVVCVCAGREPRTRVIWLLREGGWLGGAAQLCSTQEGTCGEEGGGPIGFGVSPPPFPLYVLCLSLSSFQYSI